MSFPLFFFFSGPPADHWALVSGLPTYVAENGFVSAEEFLLRGDRNYQQAARIHS